MLCVVLFVCVLVGYFMIGGGVYYWKEYVHHYESGTVARLFALHTMQDNYKADHGSYACTVPQLGLPLGASLNGDPLTWDGGPTVIELLRRSVIRWGVLWSHRSATDGVLKRK
jgi:hypothetical protein